jgi:hypothetical protein
MKALQSMAASGRRVKLDLSSFVRDAGSHRWMLLAPGRLSTVGDLLLQLRAEYPQVEEADTLTLFLEEQYMVPPWEPLDILEKGDQLRVTLSRPAARPPPAKRPRLAGGAGGRRAPTAPTSSSDSSSEAEAPARKAPAGKALSKAAPAKAAPAVARAGEESSSGGSSSEEEGAGGSGAAKRAAPVPAQPKKAASSSSSSSDTDEDKPAEQVVTKKPVPQKDSSSSSSESEEDTTKDVAKQKPTVRKQPAAKSSSDSSSSDSSKEAEAKVGPWKPVQNGAAAGEPADATNGKPKKKRKRKPKNRNKLPASQVPDFGPPIQVSRSSPDHLYPAPQADPAFLAKPDIGRNNVHQRFGEREESLAGDELSAEAQRALYSQSVAAVPQPLLDPRFTASLKAASPRHEPPAAASSPAPRPATGSVSACEGALLASLDSRVASNRETVARSAPRVVFRPRALDVSKLAAPNGVAARPPARQPAPVAGGGLESLLGCAGTVFTRSHLPGQRDYDNLPGLAAPAVGQVVAYKVIEMGEDYTPGVSQYKEARVVGLEGEQLELQLVSGAARRAGGKFELAEEETVEGAVRLRLGDMIQPVLVTPV